MSSVPTIWPARIGRAEALQIDPDLEVVDLLVAHDDAEVPVHHRFQRSQPPGDAGFRQHVAVGRQRDEVELIEAVFEQARRVVPAVGAAQHDADELHAVPGSGHDETVPGAAGGAGLDPFDAFEPPQETIRVLP